MTIASITLETLLLHHEVNQLNAEYAAALDERRFDDWPVLFVENGSYKLQARENFDRGLPLCLMDLESRGMMQDRVYGITQTIYHGPYRTRHVVSPAQVLGSPGESGSTDGVLRAQTHYAVFRARPGDVGEVFSVGRYIDELVREDGALRFLSRRAVYDTEMVLNSVIYPV